MKRTDEIREHWQNTSNKFGRHLCDLLRTDISHLNWDRVWHSQEYTFMSSYFDGKYVRELAYLCRALSLNMHLDDNEELINEGNK